MQSSLTVTTCLLAAAEKKYSNDMILMIFVSRFRASPENFSTIFIDKARSHFQKDNHATKRQFLSNCVHESDERLQ